MARLAPAMGDFSRIYAGVVRPPVRRCRCLPRPRVALGWLFQGPSRRAVLLLVDWTLLASMCVCVSTSWLVGCAVSSPRSCPLLAAIEQFMKKEDCQTTKTHGNTSQDMTSRPFQPSGNRNMVKHLQSSSVSAAPYPTIHKPLSLHSPLLSTASQDPRHLLTASAHGSIHRGLLGLCPSLPSLFASSAWFFMLLVLPGFTFRGPPTLHSVKGSPLS